tara:strand:- start:853 stop:1059 length:207 start_codon:yes stop_codon:yes gene_type:complete
MIKKLLTYLEQLDLDWNPPHIHEVKAQRYSPEELAHDVDNLPCSYSLLQRYDEKTKCVVYAFYFKDGE